MTENIESSLIAYMNEVARLAAERDKLLQALKIAQKYMHGRHMDLLGGNYHE